MKSRNLLRGFALATLGVTLACGADREVAPTPAPPAASAAAGHEPGGHEGHEGHEGMSGMSGPGAASAEAPAGGAWAQLKQARDEVAEVVAAGELSEVHAKAERLAPLAEALVAGAQALPEERRSRVAATLRQIPGIARALHEAADAGDAAATQRELKRLDGAIALLEAQLPAEVRDGVPAPGGAGHGSHGGVSQTVPGHDHSAHAARPLAAVDEAPRATLRVTSTEFAFEPASLVMRAGEATRIELENHGAVDHALIVAARDGKGDLIHLHALAHATDAGTYRIDEPGRYEVLCTVAGHTEAGMVGELIVR